MGRLICKRKYRDLFLGVGLLLAAGALVAWPRQAMAAMRDGLSLCGNVIIPSLLPFFVLSSLVVELGMSRYLGRLLEPVMVPLFRVNGACASALALGNRTIMMNDGKIIFDVSGEEKKNLTVEDLLRKFSENSGEAFADDRAILG